MKQKQHEHFLFTMSCNLSSFDATHYSNLTYLNLRSNKLTTIQFIVNLPELKFLDVGLNQITTLNIHKSYNCQLEVLRIEGNSIERVEEFIRLDTMKHLILEFNQQSNPLCLSTDYPHRIIRFLELDSLDGIDRNGLQVHSDVLFGYDYFKKVPSQFPQLKAKETQSNLLEYYSKQCQYELESKDMGCQAELVDLKKNEELENIIKQNLDYKARNEELSDKLHLLHSQFSTVKNELQLSKQDSQATLTEFVTISEKIGSLNTRETTQIIKLKSQLSNLNDQLTSKADLIEKLETANNLLHHNIKKQKSGNKVLTETIKTLESEIQSLNACNSKLSLELDTITQELINYKEETEIADIRIKEIKGLAENVITEAQEHKIAIFSKCLLFISSLKCFKKLPLFTYTKFTHINYTTSTNIPQITQTLQAQTQLIHTIFNQLYNNTIVIENEKQQLIDKNTTIKSNLSNKIMDYQKLKLSFTTLQDTHSTLSAEYRTKHDQLQQVIQVAEGLKEELHSNCKKIKKIKSKLKSKKHEPDYMDMQEKMELLDKYQSLKSAIQQLQDKHAQQQDVIYLMKSKEIEREKSIVAAMSLLNK